MGTWNSLTAWRSTLGEAEQLRLGAAFEACARTLERARGEAWHDESMAAVAFETGRLHRAMDQPGEARAAFESATRLAPTPYEARVAWLYLCQEREPDDRAFALSLSQAAWDRDDRDPQHWLVLGAAHYRQEDLAQALNSLQNALAHRIAEPITARELGFLALTEARLGASKDAVRHFTQALHWIQKHSPQVDPPLRSVLREVEGALGIEIR